MGISRTGFKSIFENHILLLETLLDKNKLTAHFLVKKNSQSEYWKSNSLPDPCIFISKDMIILVYFDDCILISKEALVIQKFISSLKSGTEDLVFTGEGTMNSYLGVDISPFPDKKGFVLSQPLLIDGIIQSLNLDLKTTKSATKNTPAGYPLLNEDENGRARKVSWKYWGIVGMLGYLKGTTHPDIAM